VNINLIRWLWYNQSTLEAALSEIAKAAKVKQSKDIDTSYNL
jgi:hypothetical protein